MAICTYAVHILSQLGIICKDVLSKENFKFIWCKEWARNNVQKDWIRVKQSSQCNYYGNIKEAVEIEGTGRIWNACTVGQEAPKSSQYSRFIKDSTEFSTILEHNSLGVPDSNFDIRISKYNMATMIFIFRIAWN